MNYRNNNITALVVFDIPAFSALACIAVNSSSVIVGFRDMKLIPSKTRTPPLDKHWN